MIRIGLTGNIGSGKSMVAKIFSVLGVPVFHADEESKNFLARDDIKQKIKARFGDHVLTPGREIDRKVLASIVFSDASALNHLNKILHPIVMIEFDCWCKIHEKDPYVIMESAIIFEHGYEKEFDTMIHVSCPEELSVERVSVRDGIPGEEVRKRMKFQLPDEEKARKADRMILNDGKQMVIPQVLEIHRILSGGKTNKMPGQ